MNGIDFHMHFYIYLVHDDAGESDDDQEQLLSAASHAHIASCKNLF